MAISTRPGFRAAVIGAAAGALVVGGLSLAVSWGGLRLGGGSAQAATLTAAQSGPAHITVTGTGTVTGTPNQLILSMGVQVSAVSVTTALDQANEAVSRVSAALTARGVAAADIQTADFSISPNFRSSSAVVVSYTVSESLNATLDHLGRAGGQIEAAVRAGGNAVTVQDISLNLTNDSSLLAAARASAVHDANTQAEQYARALGEPLGPVLSLTSTADQDNTLPEPLFSAAGAAGKSVPISPGSQQVSVSVTVVYQA